MSVLLCILDGWGHGKNHKYNAIHQAKTPYWEHLISSYPNCKISTSGSSVGLPEGQMGNSEVGHMTIGSGRIIEHSLVRLNKKILNVHNNQDFKNFITTLQDNGGKCHLMGLLSPGGVHSHQDHMASLSKTLSENSIKVELHAFLDGRDTPPKSALNYIKGFNPSTICGRYYAMDRDKNFTRTQKAYELIRFAQSEKKFPAAQEAIEYYYSQGITDEFILPTVIGDYSGAQKGDGILMSNFRPDRVRQILSAFDQKTFEILGMVEYSQELGIKSILPNIETKNTLGEVVSKAGMKQLRIAETEKYAHVTFFFSGGREKQFLNEERILVPSPKVATYDLKPEMSAYEITDSLVKILEKNEFDLIVLNYANPDMVGHSGNMGATVQAIEIIDKCLSKVIPIAIQKKIDTIITADHGNAELMYDEVSDQAMTTHTTNPVPLIIVTEKKISINDGSLSDIAPTVLELLNLDKPDEMSGNSIIKLK